MINLLPSNIGVLAACLKQNGFDVKVFDSTLYKTEDKSLDEIRVEHLQLRPFNLSEKGVEYKKTDIYNDFQKAVKHFKPNLIGVSVTDDTYELGISLINRIREKNIYTVFGGIYSIFNPEKVIKNDCVDAICIGEGEDALVELCKNIENKKDINKIQNLWVKSDGKIIKNKIRPLVDINKLPLEDFSIFEKKRFYRPMQGKIYRMIPITIDRGCPFKCSFCAAPFINKLYRDSGHKNYYRQKEANQIIREIQIQVKKYQADYIYFNSETFFARKQKEIEKIGRQYEKNIGLPFWCQTRVETITEERIKLLEDMNCDRISIGLEHGNEKFRKKMNKHFSNNQAIKAFKIIEKSGIPVTVNNIIGFPDETRELVFDTIELNRKIVADSINALVFTPYSGTPMRQYCIEKGYINRDAKTDSLIKSSILKMPQLSKEEINGLVRTFPLYIKMPKSYFKKIEIAEKNTDKGNMMYNELREMFYEKYFD